MRSFSVIARANFPTRRGTRTSCQAALKVAAAGAKSKEEIHKVVKGVWRWLVATELTNTDLRVQRNMERFLVEHGGNYYGESQTKGVVPYTMI